MNLFRLYKSKLIRGYNIELPRFQKPETDCDSFFDRLIYNLVNMENMNELAFKDQNAILGRLEQIAFQANLSKKDA